MRCQRGLSECRVHVIKFERSDELATAKREAGRQGRTGEPWGLCLKCDRAIFDSHAFGVLDREVGTKGRGCERGTSMLGARAPRGLNCLSDRRSDHSAYALLSSSVRVQDRLLVRCSHRWDRPVATEWNGWTTEHQNQCEAPPSKPKSRPREVIAPTRGLPAWLCPS